MEGTTMTKLILTSGQKAALDLAGETMADLAIPTLTLKFTRPGRFSVVAEAHPGTFDFVFGDGDTPSLAFDDFAERFEAAVDKPKPLRKPSEVVKAVHDIIEDVAGGETAISTQYLKELLDELPVQS